MAKYDGWFMYFNDRWGVLRWKAEKSYYHRCRMEDVADKVLGIWSDDKIEVSVQFEDARLEHPKKHFLKKYFQ